MKTRFILLLILLAIVALVIVNLLTENPSSVPASETTKESYQTLLLDEVELKGDQIIEGKLVPAVTKQVKFEVGGVLEKGDVPFRVGQEFKFNQLLMKVNLKDIFVRVSDLKVSMEKTLNSLQPELAARFPGEVPKWKEFINELDPARRLPDFPLLNSKEEGDLLRSTSFLKEYVKTAKLEEEVEQYFYLAPFDGKVVSVIKRPGTEISAGQAVGVISKKGSYSVAIDNMFKVALKDSRSLEFLGKDGKNVGTGKYLRTTGKSLIYTFSPKTPGFEPTTVSIKISNGVKCFRIPTSSVIDKKVRILTGEMVSEREISVIQESGDSLYVSGLKEGEVLILR